MTAIGSVRFLPLAPLDEQEIVSLVHHPVACGILLLLTMRSPFKGPQAGQAPGKWTQKDLAGRFGCTERHVHDQLKWLEKTGYVSRERTQTGARLTVARHPFRQEEPEPPFRFQKETGTTVPVEPEPGFRSPINESSPSEKNDSESSSKGGGGPTPTVGVGTSLTPPLATTPERFSSTEKIEAVARLLKSGGYDVLLRNFDQTAIIRCAAPPDVIYACFDDIAGGRFGTDAQRRRVNVERAIEALPGWLSERAGVRSPRGAPTGQQDYIREAMARAAAQEEAAYGAR